MGRQEGKRGVDDKAGRGLVLLWCIKRGRKKGKDDQGETVKA